MNLFEQRPKTRAFFSGFILAFIAVVCTTIVLLAEHDTKPAKAYIATDKSGKILGYIGTYSTSRGYSNPLILIAGLDTTGRLTKVDISFTRETPGIGDKVERKRGNYLDQFDGKGLYDANWDVKKFNGDFDYFTGATVTSRAVVLATRDFLEVMMGTDLEQLPNCN